MTLSRTRLALIALAVVALAVPALAQARPKPTAHLYGAKCSKKSGCKQSAYLDGKQKKIYSFNRVYNCSKSGSSLSAYMSGQPRFKKGKVTFKMSVTSSDSGEESVLGTSTVKMKLKKKKKLTGSWKIDKVAPGCKNVTKGKIKLKYKGPLYGGG
jgi:hypothetical protein